MDTAVNSILRDVDAISPIDGRYKKYTNELSKYFSEKALIKYRVKIEVEYFIQFVNNVYGILNNEIRHRLLNITDEDIRQIKEIEKTTNHDVKSIEYFIKDVVKNEFPQINKVSSFVHIGLTSQDINNPALTLMLKDSINQVILPFLGKIYEKLFTLGIKWGDIRMLSFTHGQPATPTTFGKEMNVFAYRLTNAMNKSEKYTTKFGGAVGNFMAHKVSFPNNNWEKFGDDFMKSIGLERQQFTTQIDNYDDMCEIFDKYKRINTILIDMCRDLWTYISKNYLLLKKKQNEVGSSAMPHKVNPINFENAEGNLMLSNNLFSFLSQKLPVSRLQRDLTDSTVTRNIGTAFAHMLTALKNIELGLDKIVPNTDIIAKDLSDNFVIVSELIQTIMKSRHKDNAYEELKILTRGTNIPNKDLIEFIKNNLDELEIERIKDFIPFPNQ